MDAEDQSHDALSILEGGASYGDGQAKNLKNRTSEFALRIIRLFGALPNSVEAQVIGKQLLRSGTAVGAHFREGTRASSTAEIISKVELAIQELEETSYWMELLVGANIIHEERLSALMAEALELNAILTTCVKRIKENRDRKKHK